MPVPSKPLMIRPRTVHPGAPILKPFEVEFAPLSSTTGVPAKPGWVVPSITTGSVMDGRDRTGLMVREGPLMLKVIVSRPGAALASRIACRREPGPKSPVFVTTKVAAARAVGSNRAKG